MDRWVGRVALVTGASVGIGAAICRQLVNAGMKVVGAARNEEKIKAIAQELSGAKGSLTAVRCDLTKDADIEALFGTIEAQFGGVDVCINNAGMSHNSTLLEGSPAEWREMLDINVVALCLCTKLAVQSMRRRGVDDGQVIHVSSMSGHRVTHTPSVHFYTASKFAVTALLEGLRQELRDAKTNIRVAAVSPGVVETEFAARMRNDEQSAKQFYASMHCLQPDDVAASVLHILAAPPHVQIHDVLMRPTEQVS